MRGVLIVLTCTICAGIASGAYEEELTSNNALTAFAALLKEVAPPAAFNPAGAGARLLLAKRHAAAPLMSDTMNYKQFEGTDTPDFFDDEEDPNAPDFWEGIRGSQGIYDEINENKPQSSAQAQLDAALNTDGAMIVETEQLERDVKFELDEDSFIEDEITINVNPGMTAKHVLTIPAILPTFEDYAAGFTADSNRRLSVTPASGRMDRKGGAPTQIQINCDTSQDLEGDFKGTLCFVLPDEPEFNQYYEIKFHLMSR